MNNKIYSAVPSKFMIPDRRCVQVVRVLSATTRVHRLFWFMPLP